MKDFAVVGGAYSKAYRHLGVADVRALGDELNRFGVLCVCLPAIPAPGLIG